MRNKKHTDINPNKFIQNKTDKQGYQTGSAGKH